MTETKKQSHWYKQPWVVILFLVVIAIFFGLIVLANIKPDTELEKSAEIAAENNLVNQTALDLTKQLSEFSDWWLGEGESLKRAEIVEKEVFIEVDMGENDYPFGLTLTDVSQTRASRITDALLKDDFGYEWEVVSLDFGNGGKVRLNKNQAVTEDFVSSEGVTIILKYFGQVLEDSWVEVK
ncbi:hypothetical protein FWH30_01215 [Microgenomates group bacterium]|nr:hypothetical protein [Microgenomates group bacterium]